MLVGVAQALFVVGGGRGFALFYGRADNVARYLVAYAGELSINTLKLRLSALAQWHNSQGFADPTKAPVVRKVFKGIRALHPAQEKQAEPLQLQHLEQVVASLELEAQTAKSQNDQADSVKSPARYGADPAGLLARFPQR